MKRGYREGNCRRIYVCIFFEGSQRECLAAAKFSQSLMKLLSAARDDVAELIREPLWPI